MEGTTDDLFGGWSVGGLKELPMLLDALHAWQRRAPPDAPPGWRRPRQVTLLGGDIHFGFAARHQRTDRGAA